MTLDPTSLLATLQKAKNQIPAEITPLDLEHPDIKKLRRALPGAIDALLTLEEALDPVRQPPRVFNPSSKDVSLEAIRREIEASPRAHLRDITQFYGAGIYLLYYKGAHQSYAHVAKTEIPIYIGKAEPKSSSEQIKDHGLALYTRLSDHIKSIRAAQLHTEATLSLDDFDYRVLVLGSSWPTLAEQYMIEHYKPLWNKETKVCQGFGKHGDSSETRRNLKSDWDTLHPGRPWATSASPGRTRAEIHDAIQQHCQYYSRFSSRSLTP